jgi:hypothetical protein
MEDPVEICRERGWPFLPFELCLATVPHPLPHDADQEDDDTLSRAHGDPPVLAAPTNIYSVTATCERRGCQHQNRCRLKIHSLKAAT